MSVFPTHSAWSTELQPAFADVLFHTAPFPIEIFDADGVLRHINQATGLLFGIDDVQSLVGRLNVLEDPFCRRLGKSAYFTQALAGEAVSIFGVTVDLTDSANRWETQSRCLTLDWYFQPVRCADGSVEAVIHFTNDATERRRLEANLRQAAKLEAIGRLTGGIAHDFSNLMTGIVGSLELLPTPTTPIDQRLFQAVRDSAGRASSLTATLLSFARPTQPLFKPLLLNALIADTIALMRTTLGRSLRLETDGLNERWLIHGEAGGIQQVLINLCLNARDAMPNGGRISIRIRQAEERPKEVLAEAARFGLVCLSIEDTGCGMPRETLDRLFEPFFTTKSETGNGLGLAMVATIIRRHNGAIRVYSEVGRGTRFDIFLPLADPSTAAG